MSADLRQNYLELCVALSQPVNPFIEEMLLQACQKQDQLSHEIKINIAGNNRLVPVQRITDEDALVLSFVLRSNMSIIGLDLRYNRLTDKGAEYIGRLLQEAPALRYLNLMCNDIGGKGAKFLASALHRNESLKYLKMTGNKIGNIGGMHIASMLQINLSLEELDLGDCDLDTQSLIALTTVLNQNKNILAINLNRPLLHSLQEETTDHIAYMLRRNSFLRELHLSKHGMTDYGVKCLYDALQENATLQYLDLSCNRITRDGVKWLAKLLEQNTALEILDLTSNRMEDDGAVYLSEAIAAYNNTLKALAVVSNNITGKGLVALANSLNANTVLSYIYIWGNKFDEATCVAFSELLNIGRLKPSDTDVRPYVVDGRVYLAELFHGLRKHYYWTPSYGEVDSFDCNSSLAIRASTA
uniref:Leucine-rich repeat-containing protein 34 isoform X1 n=1 Tax=Geotrypetes seraphini TaxID=260995 RepID=A0A6P8SBE0_GEOSA|nr:leucine-rich repeat-containing protein 34 isoform X1 [Geotrypetes seraphini]XP_033815578.1 leucine-rich repeat-containing protein 34 isoform X1 [Geotrypetes seraphini]XP_033815579.1 leucine-rich repeat-containing protein 34 isoform X1 [Geotrypetes seraphini]